MTTVQLLFVRWENNILNCPDNFSSPQSIQFVDHRKIEWGKVKRTRYFLYQRFEYQYPGPVHNLRQRLIVIPAQNGHSDQQLRDHRLTAAPSPLSIHNIADLFGNHVIELDIPRIETSVVFEISMAIERTALSVDHHPALISIRRASVFLSQTALTAADEAIATVTRDLKERSRTELEFAERASDWIYHRMRYGPGATDVKTTASQALLAGQGLCQDYAHLMLSICREAGLPSRYVSGHMLGEGGSHAWVEVLLPSERNGLLEAFAFDPTNQRRPNLKYLRVATGRDYSDVSPTSGRFTAPYSGRLTFTKKAGLIFIEYLDGEIVSSG